MAFVKLITRAHYPQLSFAGVSPRFRPLAILMPVLLFLRGLGDAGVAQLVEHLICNQRVGGSIPSASSTKIFIECRQSL